MNISALFLTFGGASTWNVFCAPMLGPGLRTIFEGDIGKGLCVTLLSCLIPHVALGLYVPLVVFGFPFCFICYWPHFLVARRESEAVAAGPATMTMGDGQTLGGGGDLGSQVMRNVANPLVAARSIFNAAPRYPERFRLAMDKLMEETGECVICLDPLCAKPVGCLMSRTPEDADLANPTRLGLLRACRHYFHQECLTQGFRQGQRHHCPLCRVEFRDTIRFPQISLEPEPGQNAHWFYLASAGQDQLPKANLDMTLDAVLPLDQDTVEAQTTQFYELEEFDAGLGIDRFNNRVPAWMIEVFQMDAAGSVPAMVVTAPPLGKDLSMPLLGHSLIGDHLAQPNVQARGPDSMIGSQPNLGQHPSSGSTRYSASLDITPTSPEELFQMVDTRRSGTLSSAQIIRGMLKVRCIRERYDREQIEIVVGVSWQSFVDASRMTAEVNVIGLQQFQQLFKLVCLQLGTRDTTIFNHANDVEMR